MGKERQLHLLCLENPWMEEQVAVHGVAQRSRTFTRAEFQFSHGKNKKAKEKGAEMALSSLDSVIINLKETEDM